MKPIAIHNQNWGFTARWIEYCEQNSIPFIKVDCYDSNIIEILKGCSALMWQWDYANYKDLIFARQLLISVQAFNLKVFPDFWTTLLFDDKLGQKYLFESLDIPIPKTYVFYEKEQALKWVKTTQFPKVFKLRCGAGSQNVKLVKDPGAAKRLIAKAFSTGFSSKNKRNIFRDRLTRYMRERNNNNLISMMRILYRSVIQGYNEKFIPREKGYVYFQDFLSDNSFDTRLIILGQRCFGLRRNNRKNDFRASGSGLLEYNPERIDKRAVSIAFAVSEKLNTSSLALDFLTDSNGDPVVNEMSYSFPLGDFTDNFEGFWDKELNWHEGKQNLQYLMVEDLVLYLKMDSSR